MSICIRIVLLLASINLVGCHYFKTEQALKELKAENYHDSYEGFLDAWSLKPEFHMNQFNLALGYIFIEEFDNSRKYFFNLEDYNNGTNSKLSYSYYFNIAKTYEFEKNKDKAVEFYQKALDIQPDAIQPKVNIELLLTDQKGKGKGDSDSEDQKEDGDPSDQKDGEGQQDQQEKQKEPQDNGKKETEDKNLSESDLEKIVDELKQQEGKIRVRTQNQKMKDKPDEKNW